MAAGQSDSMAEGLKKVLSQVAQMQVLPDADMGFLQALQQGIVHYLQQNASKMAHAGAMGGPPNPMAGVGGGMGGAPPSSPMGGGMGGMGGMGGGAPMSPPPPPAGIAPGGGAGMAGLSAAGQLTTNPDELRRLLSGPGGMPGGAS